MHDFWKILIANMTYTKWNYITMVVGEHGIQTLKVVVIVVVFVPTSAHPLVFSDKWFVQIYLNVTLQN